RRLLPQVFEELLDAGEEAFAFGVGSVVLAFPFEFAEQFLLAFVQIDRGLDDRLDKHVAAGGRAQHRHSLPTQPELVPRLGPGRHGDACPATVHRRYLDRAAEGGRRERQRYAAMDVGAVTLKNSVRRHADEDKQIARRGTADTDLAFSGKPHADAVLYPGRDVHRQGFFAPHPALAATSLARIVDDPSGTLTAGASLLDREEALLHA